jgi:ABC-type protease/lipase transport system fused ATPase/permease subunit
MDEPTSALDLHTETEVVAAVEELMRGRTTFVVAHRTSTLERCDVVFHLEGGQLKIVADRRPVSYPVCGQERRTDGAVLVRGRAALAGSQTGP